MTMWHCARLSVKCQHYKKQNGRIFPVYVDSCHKAPACIRLKVFRFPELRAGWLVMGALR